MSSFDREYKFDSPIGTDAIEIKYGDQVYYLKVAETEQELVEVKALDDLAFGGHIGISLEELEAIQRSGAVILLRDGQGRLVGETQVITSPISYHENLAPDEAYDYGTAIAPNLQNAGLGQLLYHAQQKVAIQAGKQRNTLTVRLENGSSVRGRFKAGYHVTDYDPSRYGPLDEGGARLIVEKRHLEPLGVHHAEALGAQFSSGMAHLVMSHNVELVLSGNPELVGIPVDCGDEIDRHAHEMVAAITERSGILGLGLLLPREAGIASDHSVLVLRREV